MSEERPEPLPRLVGPPPGEASSALVLLHGRGATPAGLRPLAEAVATGSTCVVAPAAHGNTWYPRRFLEPRERNEPWLGRALGIVSGVVEGLVETGIPRDHIVVSGFSQGACLAAEFVARYPARYAGLVAFAGALVGEDPSRGGYGGDLAGTPVHFGVGTLDEHVPVPFVRASADVLERMGGAVSVRVHEGLGHTIHEEDVRVLADLLRFRGR